MCLGTTAELHMFHWSVPAEISQGLVTLQGSRNFKPLVSQNHLENLSSEFFSLSEHLARPNRLI